MCVTIGQGLDMVPDMDTQTVKRGMQSDGRSKGIPPRRMRAAFFVFILCEAGCIAGAFICLDLSGQPLLFFEIAVSVLCMVSCLLHLGLLLATFPVRRCRGIRLALFVPLAAYLCLKVWALTGVFLDPAKGESVKLGASETVADHPLPSE